MANYVPVPGRRRFPHPNTYCDDVFDIDPEDYRDLGRNKQGDILIDVQDSLRPFGLELERMVGGYRSEVYGRTEPCRQIREGTRDRWVTRGERHPLNFVAWTPGGELVFQKYEGKGKGSGHSYIYVGRRKMNTGEWLSISNDDKRNMLDNAAEVVT